MNKLLFLPLFLSLAYALASPTLAYFSDTEVSQGNTFTAGTWKSEAECLVAVADECTKLTGNGFKEHWIELSNECESTPVLTHAVVSWVDNNGELLTKFQVTGSGGTEWAGSAISGDTIDPVDVLFQGPEKHKLMLTFNEDMAGKYITVRLIMRDGSVKEVSFTPRKGGSCGKGHDGCKPGEEGCGHDGGCGEGHDGCGGDGHNGGCGEGRGGGCSGDGCGSDGGCGGDGNGGNCNQDGGCSGDGRGSDGGCGGNCGNGSGCSGSDCGSGGSDGSGSSGSSDAGIDSGSSGGSDSDGSGSSDGGSDGSSGSGSGPNNGPVS